MQIFLHECSKVIRRFYPKTPPVQGGKLGQAYTLVRKFSHPTYPVRNDAYSSPQLLSHALLDIINIHTVQYSFINNLSARGPNSECTPK